MNVIFIYIHIMTRSIKTTDTNYVDSITLLADRLERKIRKAAQEVSQSGTTDLFFASPSKQREFAAAIQNQSGTCFKLLSAYYAKTEKPCSLHISVSADPGQKAEFDIAVNPPALNTTLRMEVDKVFKAIMGQSINDRLKAVNTAVSKGAGSGRLDIASLDLE